MACVWLAFVHLPKNTSGQSVFKTQTDTLLALMYDYNLKPTEAQRLEANYLFIKTLVKTLRLENSLKIKFDTLKTVSVLYPSDSSFRLFSWAVKLDKAVYRHFGCIQMNNPTADSPLKIISLIDKSDEISDAQTEPLNDKRWFGAVYYQMIETKKSAKTYYTLLGFDANEPFSNKRIIEILTFDDTRTKALFGADVFENTVADKNKGSKNEPIEQRRIFEYKKQASMLLRYDKNYKWIIFDHLVPIDQQNERLFFDYVPDLSYDAYEWKKGKWVLKEDVKIKSK